MRPLLISLLLTTLLVSSCDNSLEIKEFPKIITLNVTDNNCSGALFQGKMIQEGQKPISSYGFIWFSEELDSSAVHKVVLGKTLSSGLFKIRIDSALCAGFDYTVQTFAVFGEQTYFGNPVTFTSKGSLTTSWAKTMNKQLFEGFGSAMGFTNGKNGYFIMSNKKCYRIDTLQNKPIKIPDFPLSIPINRTLPTVMLDDRLYLISDLRTNMFIQFKNDTWQMSTPFNSFMDENFKYCYAYKKNILSLGVRNSILYYPSTSTYENVKNSPASLDGYPLIGTNLNDKAYLLYSRKDIVSYDPDQNNWEIVDTFPGNTFTDGLKNRIAFSYKNKLYFGTCKNKQSDIELWSYDLSSKEWTKYGGFPKMLPVGNFFYFFLNGKLHVGYYDINETLLKQLTMYQLDISKLEQDRAIRKGLSTIRTPSNP